MKTVDDLKQLVIDTTYKAIEEAGVASIDLSLLEFIFKNDTVRISNDAVRISNVIVKEEPKSKGKTSRSKKEVIEDVEITDENMEKEPEEQEEAKDKIYTFEEIRSACANLTRTGKRETVKVLLKGFGLEKLTDLQENKYQKFMAEVLSLEC